MRAPSLTLTLTAGLAFSAAWGLASLQESEERGTAKHGGRIPALRQDAAGNQHVESTAISAEAGGMLDALVRQAVEGTDLVAGVKEILAHRNEDHCADTRLVCMVENLPAARLAELPRLLDHFFSDDYVVKFVLGTWAQRDAAGALAWVQAHGALNDSGVHSFLRGWSRAAPEAALTWADAQPLSTKTGTLRTALVEAMAEKSPAAALTLMQERGWTGQYPNAVLKLLHNWGGHDPAAALAGLRSLTAEMGLKFEAPIPGMPPGASSNNQSFRVMLKALLNGAFDRHPADAGALLSQLTAEELAAGSDAVASEVLARDPSSCDGLFVPHPDAAARRMLVGLAAVSPGVVLSNLGRVQDRALQTELLLAATAIHHSSRGSTVPSEAQPILKAVLEGMTDENQRDHTATTLSLMTASSSPAWAAELWQGLPPDTQLRNAHEFYRGIAPADSEVALRAYAASSPELQSQSLKTLCYGLASSDPRAALQLVLQRPEPDLRAACTATLFAFWAKENQEAAFAALEQHAGQLDLNAVRQQLQAAGDFLYGVNSQTGSWTSSRSENVSISGLSAKIKQLTGTAPAPGQ